MKNLFVFILISFLYTGLQAGERIIVDHNCTEITTIPTKAIKAAKQKLHIAYNHTSHGSQLITGMTELVDFANQGGLGLDWEENLFKFNNGGTSGGLDIHDNFAGWSDCGRYPEWINLTREYLNDQKNSDVN